MLIVTTESKAHTLLEVKTQLPLRCFDVLSELCLKYGWHVNTIALLYAHYDEFIPYGENVHKLGVVRAVAIKGQEILVYYAPRKLFQRVFARAPRTAANVLSLFPKVSARLLKRDMRTPYKADDLINPGESVFIQVSKNKQTGIGFLCVIALLVFVFFVNFFRNG
jgi:hypothetical protein